MKNHLKSLREYIDALRAIGEVQKIDLEVDLNLEIGAIAMQNDWRKITDLNAIQLCQNIGDALFKTKAGMGTPKYLVVNDDIDITNLKEVVWAFATRNHPGSSGEIVFNEESTNPLVAYLKKVEQMSMHTTKVIYNCLPPDELGWELPKRSSFAGTYSEQLQQKVLQNWQAYGFRST